MKRQFQTVLIGASLLAFGLSGCEQRRSARFQQGDGEYLFSIDDITNRKVSITSGEVIKSGLANVTSATTLVTPGENNIIRSYDIVSFRLNDSDFNIDSNTVTYDFFGDSNQTYDAVYTLTENHLIVNKVAKKEQLPTPELTYAVEMADGLYRVPLFGFPIKKYVTERIEDSRGKKTDRIRTIEKKYLKDATHISVAESQVKAFKSPDKRDLVSSDFFAEGEEWYYVKTLVDRPAIPVGRICDEVDEDGNPIEICNELGMQDIDGKIAFKRTQSSVIAYDLNIPEETPDERTKQILVEIPVEWLDYRLDQEGLEEIELKDGVYGVRPWEQRSFAKLDLKRVGNLDTSSSDKNKVEYLEVSDNYLGFKIFESDSQKTYFYSMVKAPKDKKSPRFYPTADHKRFGFFATIRAYMGDDLNINRYDEVDSLFYLNRIYPHNGEKTIKIYLTKDSARHPNGDYAKAVEDAVNSWNEAFKAAGADFTLEFGGSADEDRVQNGDVRYHKVAIYPEDRRSRLLGYGPSVQDSTTGETFSSTNHIYLRNYKLGLKRSIQKYIYWQLGAYDGNSLDTAETLILDSLPELSVNNDGSAIASLNGFAVDFSLIPDGSKAVNLELPNPNIIKTKSYKYQSCEYLENSLPITVKMIQDKCLVANGQPTPFARYIEQLKAQRSTESYSNLSYAGVFQDDDYILNEAAALEDCASKLIGDKLRATLVHEFGHNFGLRHNFAGSADIANLRIDPETNTLQTSTSVMDYAHNDADRIINLGSYDFAAVKYAYANKVDIVNAATGEVKEVSVPNGTSLTELIKSYPGYFLKPYRFCTDDDVADLGIQIPIFDPMCKKWDNGATAEANVIDILQRFQADLLAHKKRLDRKYGFLTEEGFDNMVRVAFGSLKQIYDYYRWMLIRKDPTVPPSVKYLREHTNAQIENLQNAALQEYKEEFADYKRAADKIKDFLFDVAFGKSNKYCVFHDQNDPDGLPYLLPFGIERSAILYQNKDKSPEDYLVQDCQDLAQRGTLLYWLYQALNRDTSELSVHGNLDITSFGTPHENTQDVDRDNPRNFATVEYGYGTIRTAAIEMLLAATDDISAGGAPPTPSVEILALGFTPSFADEPTLRQEVLRYLENRVLYGVSYKNTGIERFSDVDTSPVNPASDLIQPGFFPEFQAESDYLKSIIGHLKSRLSLSERVSLAITATARNSVEANNFKASRGNAQEKYAVMKVGEVHYFADRITNFRAAKLIDKWNLIQAGFEALYTVDYSLPESEWRRSLTSILENRLFPHLTSEEFEELTQDEKTLENSIQKVERLRDLYERMELDFDDQKELITDLLILQVIR